MIGGHTSWLFLKEPIKASGGHHLRGPVAGRMALALSGLRGDDDGTTARAPAPRRQSMATALGHASHDRDHAAVVGPTRGRRHLAPVSCSDRRRLAPEGRERLQIGAVDGSR